MPIKVVEVHTVRQGNSTQPPTRRRQSSNADYRMSHCGDNHSGRLLTIGQVTALTGVRKSTIRHWEREFQDFLMSVRTEGNQRRFSPDAVQKIEKIKTLVEEQGMTLKGVRRLLEVDQQHAQTAPAAEPAQTDVSLQKLAELMSEQIIRRLFYEK